MPAALVQGISAYSRSVTWPCLSFSGRQLAEKVDLDCLVYDTTNYFNYWDVTNNSELAKMTKSKAGKHHLRHIGLALSVDRNFGLPLFHRLYPANEHDSKVFNKLLTAMCDQISEMIGDKKGLTFVFDKGNNSEDAIHQLDESRMMEQLRGIKSAVLYYPKSTKPVRQMCCLSAGQQELVTMLNVPNQT